MKKVLALGFVIGGVIISSTYCQFVEGPIPSREPDPIDSSRVYPVRQEEGLVFDQRTVDYNQSSWKGRSFNYWMTTERGAHVVRENLVKLNEVLEGFRQEDQRKALEYTARARQQKDYDREVSRIYLEDHERQRLGYEQSLRAQLAATIERAVTAENERDGAMAGVVWLHAQNERLKNRLRDLGLNDGQIDAIVNSR